MEYFHAHNKDKHPYADTFVTDKQVRKVRVRGYVCYRSSEGIRHDFYMLQLDNKSNRMCHCNSSTVAACRRKIISFDKLRGFASLQHQLLLRKVMLSHTKFKIWPTLTLHSNCRLNAALQLLEVLEAAVTDTYCL